MIVDPTEIAAMTSVVGNKLYNLQHRRIEHPIEAQELNAMLQDAIGKLTKYSDELMINEGPV